MIRPQDYISAIEATGGWERFDRIMSGLARFGQTQIDRRNRMTRRELCDLLNDHVKCIIPGWRIEFMPSAQQPGVVVAYIESEGLIAFGMEETKIGSDALKALFKQKLNDALARIAQKALDAKVT